MMLESNYWTLKHCRLSRTETEKRAQALQNAMEQLEQYHKKAKPGKRKIIASLINAYDELLNTIKIKLEK